MNVSRLADSRFVFCVVSLAAITIGCSSTSDEVAQLRQELAVETERNAKLAKQLAEQKSPAETAQRVGELTVDDFFFQFSREQLVTDYLSGWSDENSMPNIGSYQYVKEFGLAVYLSEDFDRIGKFEIAFTKDPDHIAIARTILTGLFPQFANGGFDAIIDLGEGIPVDQFAPLHIDVTVGSGYLVRLQFSPHNVAFGRARRMQREQ